MMASIQVGSTSSRSAALTGASVDSGQPGREEPSLRRQGHEVADVA